MMSSDFTPSKPADRFAIPRNGSVMYQYSIHALKPAAMRPQIVMSGTGPTLYFAIGDVWYTSPRVRGNTAPPIAVPMYMTVATAVTARVYVVYPGTML